MRIAAVKSGQLGLFFFGDNPRKSLSTNILQWYSAFRWQRLKNKIKKRSKTYLHV